MHVAFDELRVDRLVAFVHPENVASIRLLEKLGFRFDRRDTIMGMHSILFSLNAMDAQTLEDRLTRR